MVDEEEEEAEEQVADVMVSLEEAAVGVGQSMRSYCVSSTRPSTTRMKHSLLA